jgi:hypothetical protein
MAPFSDNQSSAMLQTSLATGSVEKEKKKKCFSGPFITRASGSNLYLLNTFFCANPPPSFLKNQRFFSVFFFSPKQSKQIS